MHEAMLGDQLSMSAVVVWLLQLLKASPRFAFVNDQTIKVWGVLAAVITSLGIHASYDGPAGVLTITGLTAATVATGAYQVIQQFVYQQLWYHGVMKKADPAP